MSKVYCQVANQLITQIAQGFDLPPFEDAVEIGPELVEKHRELYPYYSSVIVDGRVTELKNIWIQATTDKEAIAANGVDVATVTFTIPSGFSDRVVSVIVVGSIFELPTINGQVQIPVTTYERDEILITAQAPGFGMGRVTLMGV